MAKFPNVVGLRLTDEDVAKLDRLAARTYRGRGDVMRLLIAQAVASDSPDLIIDLGALETGEANKVEAVHAG